MKSKQIDINDSNSIAKLVVKSMLDKKATDIKIIYVEKLTTLTDIFIVCTSDSDPQSKAITNHIKDNLSDCGIKPIHIEGFQFLKWVLMDYINVTINIFNKEYREFYNVERLWADAKIETVKESIQK
tara:strand:+ start:896 stop:1276 length:381 start_codon:yes stop_codon:yes gene_type:complete